MYNPRSLLLVTRDSIAVTHGNVSAVPTGISDRDGLGSVNVSYSLCPSTATESGAVTIDVKTPDGYQPTTPTTFGPFSLKWRQASPVQTVYAGFAQGP